ncbi:undecaprenyl-diphosphatase [Alicyclobacillus cellulosilyticus]|uniref:Undecaprenyl-diphosphatase n=1 Tax=Alicyclobacillus cellulosilyticus TaxID=1003997 RepID=A0A917NGN9_9BACL|nr:undecaprenyl-diphosphate phosphatase [Alicyclobacillus cellulosilyticus]GGI99192.1 undecaprenyl-diphosphatase [Alicyclobacillus cellulosilyticus]
MVVQVLFTALVQGITEMFPVSSVGHAVIMPYLLGWTNLTASDQFLPFVVLLHLGTAIALLWYFRRDWIELIGAVLGLGGQPSGVRRANRRLFALIVVATIPAAILGKLLEHKLRQLFPSAVSASLFLMLNGVILLFADRLRRRSGQGRSGRGEIDRMSYAQSFLIGLLQALALIPGISRSGITMTAGLATGLSYEEAARFSFLLATPIILGAAVLEVPKAVHDHAHTMLAYGVLGGLVAGVFAYLATAFLMRHFKTHEVRALRPFAYYCLAVGAVVFVLALMGWHF